MGKTPVLKEDNGNISQTAKSLQSARGRSGEEKREKMAIVTARHEMSRICHDESRQIKIQIKIQIKKIKHYGPWRKNATNQGDVQTVNLGQPCRHDHRKPIQRMR